MVRRNKPTATEWVGGTVYGIWDRCYIARAEDLDDDAPLDDGMFNGLIDFGLSVDDIDRSEVPGWIERLRQSEVGLRLRRLQLEALLTDRVCPSCGGPVAGRADRVYCSTACRVRNHRRLSAMVEVES